MVALTGTEVYKTVPLESFTVKAVGPGGLRFGLVLHAVVI